jgi:hypothetical protein
MSDKWTVKGASRTVRSWVKNASNGMEERARAELLADLDHIIRLANEPKAQPVVQYDFLGNPEAYWRKPTNDEVPEQPTT